MAVETLINITQDEIEYARMCNLIKSQLDWNTDLFEARNEGRDEGFREGRDEGLREGRDEGLREGRDEGLREGLREGRIETASSLKALGVSADIIIKSTGLSPEEIAKL